MANNFFNAVKPNISAEASAPTTIYTPSAIKAIAIELDAANKSTAGVTITVSIEDNSANVSKGAVTLTAATGTFADTGHGLVVGDRVIFAATTMPNFKTGGLPPSGETALSATRIYYVQSVSADGNSFFIAETRGAGSAQLFNTAGNSITYIKKAIADVVRDAPIPVGGALKVIAGQKLVLEASDKLYAHCSSANNVDVVASVLADVS